MVLQRLLVPLELDNVDIIFKELKSKHSNMANPKLGLWAKMIDKGCHDDHENSPAIPLITGSPTPTKKKANIEDARCYHFCQCTSCSASTTYWLV